MTAGVPVLTYHAIAEADTPIAVAPAVFAATMHAMRDAGWRTVDDEAVARIARDGRWSPRTFVLHFDDGFESVRTEAASVLAACGFSATVFLVSDWVGKDNGWPSQPADVPRWPLLGWSALRELQSAGFRMGSHTASHPRLPTIDIEAQRAELDDSAKRLADELGVAPDVFAYPYGATAPATLDAVAARYRVAFGTDLAPVTPGSALLHLPRIDAWYLTPRRAADLDTLSARAYVALRRAGRRARGRLR